MLCATARPDESNRLPQIKPRALRNSVIKLFHAEPFAYHQVVYSVYRGLAYLHVLARWILWHHAHPFHPLAVKIKLVCSLTDLSWGVHCHRSRFGNCFSECSPGKPN